MSDIYVLPLILLIIVLNNVGIAFVKALSIKYTHSTVPATLIETQNIHGGMMESEESGEGQERCAKKRRIGFL